MITSLDQVLNLAERYLPGAVDASARVNAAIGRPFFVSRGDGPLVYDLEGIPYLDFCASHGASLLGHNHPQIKAAVERALDLGVICSYETQFQSELAQKIASMVPGAEMTRFAGSGTETIMHALRLARTATGREKIIKFEGHFHGYSDDLYFSLNPPLDKAGPEKTPIPYRQSAGIPEKNSERLVIVPFNDPDALEQAFIRHGMECAALILEPINYDSGCILPKPGFLQLCRKLCDHYGVLLFFDEVLTAFRIAAGGAQEYYGVIPDLAVLGKAIGAGMPISAMTGKREVMQHLRPSGSSEHSGTYLAHLTGVLAATAALEVYSQPDFYQHLNRLSQHFYPSFDEIIERSGVRCKLQYAGPRFGLYFGVDSEVTNYREAAKQDRTQLLRFIAGCIERQVYFHVSPHHGFSAVHSEADLDNALDAIEGTLVDIRKEFY